MEPGSEWIKTFADLPGDGWKQYVCLEAANCGNDVIELGTDDSHVLQQTITCSALTNHWGDQPGTPPATLTRRVVSP